MRLSELLSKSGISFESKLGMNLIEVTGIKFDSHDVEPGDLFVAILGEEFDGHEYIENAVSNGAVAAVGSKNIQIRDFPYIKVENPREILAVLGAAFYDFPAKKLTVIGVTGTDGKTTTVNLIYQLLKAHGVSVGMISTVDARIGDEELDTGFHVTTPESPTIQRYLHQMVDKGLTHVVLEATSHGLSQNRVDACEFDIAVVTNITHEHLDYHQTYDAYFQAKFKLIEKLLEPSAKKHQIIHTAVINRDDSSYPMIMERIKSPEFQQLNVIDYGFDKNSKLWAANLSSKIQNMKFEVNYEEKKFILDTELFGEFNAFNILAAIGAVSTVIDMDIQRIQNTIRNFTGVPGRMELIDLGQDFTVIVDFAHTPNALKVALESVRKLTSKRVIAVFGSAGLRDKEKRRMMAATSVDLADITILTAEDPRTEDLNEILAEMSTEAMSHGAIIEKDYYVIPDRGEAIRKAINLADKNDLVIACGKGHEQSMCFGKIEYPWDDRRAARAALSNLLGISGPEMPYLPTQEK